MQFAPSTINRLILATILLIIVAASLFRVLSALEIAVSLLIGYIVFQRFKVRSLPEDETNQPTTSHAIGSRSVFFVLGLSIIVLLAMGLFLGTQGLARSLYQVLAWAVLFVGVWGIGSSTRTAVSQGTSVAALFIVAALARASVWYSFPSGPLAEDPWFHLSLIDYILNTGRIFQNTTYASFPVMHVLTALTVLTTGLDPKTALMLAVGLPISWVSIGVFLIARNLYGFECGFTAAVLASVAANLFQWGVVLVPTSLGLALAVGVIHALTSKGHRPSRLVIAVILLGTLTLTHTIVAFVFLSALTLYLLAAQIAPFLTGSRPFSAVRAGFVVIAAATILGYWMYVSGAFPFVVEALSFGFRIERFRLSFESSSGPWLYVYRAGDSVLLALALLSTLSTIYMLQNYRRSLSNHERRASFAIATWLYTGIETLLLLGAFTALLPARWTAFGSVLQAPLAAPGVVLIQQNSRGNKRGASAVIMLLLVTVMLAHPLSNAAPLLPGDFGLRIGVTASESQAAAWVKANNLQPFYTDAFFQNLFYESGGGHQTSALDGSDILTGRTPLTGWVAYRTALNREPAEIFQNGTYVVRTLNPGVTSALSNDASMRIYDDGAVVIVGA